MTKPISSSNFSELVLSINLMAFFTAHPEYTMFEAAHELGVEPRDVKRALERLKFAGIGKFGGESLEFDYSSTKPVTIINDHGLNKALKLTPIEAASLLLTLESLESMEGLIDGDVVRSAAAKLRGIMDKDTEAMYDSMAAVDPDESRAHALFSEALQESKVVEFDYWSSSRDESSRRRTVPALIFFHETETYAVGWVEESNDFRTFRFDRIDNVTVLDEVGDAHSKELKFNPKDPFGLEKGNKADILIKETATWLTFYNRITLDPAEVATLADDEYDTPVELITDDEGETWVHATMNYLDDNWMVRFAIQQTGRVKVVGPESLVAAIAERTEKALGRYTQ